MVRTPRVDASWRQDRNARLLGGAVIGLLILLAYSNSFSSGFVLDNRVLILDDARVHEVSVDNLSNIVGRSYWWPVVESGLYRPVTTLSYLFNYAVLGNGDRPAGYHVINLLLHMANALLVYMLGLRLTRNLWMAGSIAAVWAVHPLATEAVTNIVGRADLLAAFGVLAALLAHLHAREASGNRRVLWMVAVAVAVTLGVFSKENAVAVIAVAMLYDIVVLEGRVSTTALIAGWVPFALPLLVMWAQRSLVLGDTPPVHVPFVDNPIAGAGFWQGRLTALAVAARYLWLLVWPARLSADYSFSQIPLASGTPDEWAAWLAIAGLVALTVWLWRTHRPASLVLASAFLVFAPVSNLAFATGTVMAERLFYLPSVGIIALIVIGLYALTRSLRLPMAAPVVVGVVVLALAARTWIRNPDWTSEVSLWSAAVQTAPNSFKTHGALAEALYNADPTRANLPAVVAEKEKSLAILASVPDPAAVSLPHREAATYYLELGDWLVAQGQPRTSADVLGAYRKAVGAANRFLALAAQTQRAAAQDINAAQLIASSAYERLNESEGAIAAGRNAVAMEPFNPKAYQVAAAAFASAGRYDDGAVALMSGFIVTGDKELRTLLIQMYRSGVDRERCAVSTTATGDVLNTQCAIVVQHLCAAGRDAMAIHRQKGRPDLADQLQASTLQGLGCAPENSIRMNR